MNEATANCARCPYKTIDRLCRSEDGKAPENCPTRNVPEMTERCLEEYRQRSEILEFARQAAIQEAEGYTDRSSGFARVRASKSRIEEIMAFSEKMHFHRLGLAFCIGLAREAKVVEGILSAGGFEMVSVVCKVGRISKESIGAGKEAQIAPDLEEAMCNPIQQAMILNRERTDFNVLLGLCVGHDSLFLQYARAPCTILAVKDRLLGHNPLAAVYTANSYYRCLNASNSV